MKINFNNSLKELVSGEEFYKLCKWSVCPRYDKKFYLNTNELEPNDFIFLNLDHFNEFVHFLNLNNVKKKFNLITHNSDLTFNETMYNSIQKYVNKIYPINCSIIKSNIIKIPLGFVDNKYKPHELLIDISRINLTKTIFVYMNFSIQTNSSERQPCYDLLKDKPFIYSEFNIEPVEFYKKIAMSKYVISPDGTGFDCHRIYESLLFNSIPIIKRNPLSDFYEKLPVLIVDSWKEIGQEYLEEQYDILFNNLIKWKSSNDWTKASYWLK